MSSFKPTSNKRTPPVVTAYFTVPESTDNATTYAAKYKGTNVITSAIILAVTIKLANSSSTDSEIRKMFFKGAPTKIEDLTKAPAVSTSTAAAGSTSTNSNPENDVLIEATRMNFDACIGWTIDLINAAKKKPLSAENVQGYFSSFTNAPISASNISKFYNDISCYFPDEVKDPNYRALLSESTWTNYRLTRVSAGKVLKELLPAFKELKIVTAADETAIELSAASPWDIGIANNIRGSLKAYASIYLEVCGRGIDDWHQGEKELQNLPSLKVKAAKVIFKKYLEIKLDVTTVDAVTTTAALAAYSSMWN